MSDFYSLAGYFELYWAAPLPLLLFCLWWYWIWKKRKLVPERQYQSWKREITDFRNSGEVLLKATDFENALKKKLESQQRKISALKNRVSSTSGGH